MYIKCVKVIGNTKWRQKDQKKVQSKELLESVAVPVSQEVESKCVQTKQPIKSAKAGGQKEIHKKQRVSLTKS